MEKFNMKAVTAVVVIFILIVSIFTYAAATARGRAIIFAIYNPKAVNIVAEQKQAKMTKANQEFEQQLAGTEAPKAQ